eukprot:364126-Chlamydomonas_euryale.AAC.10
MAATPLPSTAPRRSTTSQAARRCRNGWPRASAAGCERTRSTCGGWSCCRALRCRARASA